MHLVPRELEKLATIFSLGYLAQRRLARGVRLNHAEAIALISTVLHELIRDGHYAVADLMSIGRTILGRRQVLPSTWFTARQIQVEGTFPTGTYLVTVVDPIATENGDMQRALYGSCIQVPTIDLFPVLTPTDYARDYAPDKAPGYIWCIDDETTKISLCRDRDRIKLKVVNHGNRPIQVGSHYHFIETNRMLSFNRKLAQGYRLDLPAGSAMRFEPGQCRETDLVFIGGKKQIAGGNGIATGIVGHVNVTIPDDFLNDTTTGKLDKRDERFMERSEYVKMFGPTTGDVVRLGSTELYVAVEYDYRDPENYYRTPDWEQRNGSKWSERKTYYGDECNFGGGKSIRDGMAQTSYGAYKPGKVAPGGDTLYDCVDTVITNALIIDHTGIIKADIGIKDGHIHAIGRAGNPDIMDDIDINIGANTDVIGAENKIVTAGGIDTHVHILDPAQVPEALCNGLTTLVGGGAGPTTAANATTVTTGPVNIERMIKAFDHLPINVGLTGKGNNSHPFGLVEQIEAGAIGLKLHEDWGATHVAIDTCLDVCEKYDVQSTLHTDTMNECGYVGDTEKSIRNRTIHSYHTEGAGGGHAPDIIAVVKNNHILPASTNPTRPYTFNTTDEHLDMVMVAHHLSKDIPADVSFAESRIHAETMAAEDCLLDDGSISIMSSDSLAMGRIGEVVLRTWTSANKMAVGAQTSDLRDALEKNQLDEDKVLQETLKVVHPTPSKPSKPGIPQPPKPGIPQPPEPQLPIVNNFRVKRYIAKYTINPALAHGMSHLIGSVEEKKFADLVIWQPSNFGTKPDLVLKGGMIAVALGGDPNGSIPTIEPKIMRPRFATYVPETSITFVSKMSVEPIGSTQPATSPPPKLSPGAPPTTIKKGSKIEEYGLKKRVEYVQGCRVIKKTHMIHNDTMPESIEVDPETFVVSQVVDGKVIPYDAPPATSVPLAQDYFVC